MRVPTTTSPFSRHTQQHQTRHYSKGQLPSRCLSWMGRRQTRHVNLHRPTCWFTFENQLRSCFSHESAVFFCVAKTRPYTVRALYPPTAQRARLLSIVEYIGAIFMWPSCDHPRWQLHVEGRSQGGGRLGAQRTHNKAHSPPLCSDCSLVRCPSARDAPPAHSLLPIKLLRSLMCIAYCATSLAVGGTWGCCGKVSLTSFTFALPCPMKLGFTVTSVPHVELALQHCI
jgi:hypothetical protein